MLQLIVRAHSENWPWNCFLQFRSMSRMSKVVALVLIAGIVLLVIAPQFDLTNAVASRQHRSQPVTFAVGSVAASLVLALAALPVIRESAPLDGLTPILDLTCVRLC